MDRMKTEGFTYEIQFTKAADRFFCANEPFRKRFETAIHKLISEDHSENENVRKIEVNNNYYYCLTFDDIEITYAMISGRIVAITAGKKTEEKTK